MNHRYRPYWLNGTTTDIYGPTFEDAMEEAEFGAGALKTLDCWEEIEQ